jgi:hypothetical protein
VGGLSLYPRRNCLDRETALRMWTENVTWFSSEEGKKGRIAAGQLADFTVPDRDFFACPEDDIANITALLTVVGGKPVYGAGEFAAYDEDVPPPPMPDWSPVRSHGGYGASVRGTADGARSAETRASCGCAHQCTLHGHDHAQAWAANLPIEDLKSFWGALGCACWAV